MNIGIISLEWKTKEAKTVAKKVNGLCMDGQFYSEGINVTKYVKHWQPDKILKEEGEL